MYLSLFFRVLCGFPHTRRLPHLGDEVFILFFLCKLIGDFVLYKVVNEKHLKVDMIVVVNKYTELIKYI